MKILSNLMLPILTGFVTCFIFMDHSYSRPRVYTSQASEGERDTSKCLGKLNGEGIPVKLESEFEILKNKLSQAGRWNEDGTPNEKADNAIFAFLTKANITDETKDLIRQRRGLIQRQRQNPELSKQKKFTEQYALVNSKLDDDACFFELKNLLRNYN